MREDARLGHVAGWMPDSALKEATRGSAGVVAAEERNLAVQSALTAKAEVGDAGIASARAAPGARANFPAHAARCGLVASLRPRPRCLAQFSAKQQPSVKSISS